MPYGLPSQRLSYVPRPVLDVLTAQFGHFSLMIFFMSVACFMDRLHHWSNTEADVARVCLVNRLVSLTSCGLWVVQTMQRERGAVHFVVSLKIVAN